MVNVRSSWEADAETSDGGGQAVSSLPPSASQTISLRRSSPPWVARFPERLLLSDIACVIVAVGIAQFVNFSVLGDRDLVEGIDWRGVVDPTWFSVIIAAAWLFALAASGSRDARVLGAGTTEYVRVFNASFFVFGVIAITAYLTEYEFARTYVAIAMPTGLVFLLISRQVWRQWLTRMRIRGYFQNRVVVAGSAAGVAHIVEQLRSAKRAGFGVQGVCVPGGVANGRLRKLGVPVLGDIDDSIDALARVNAHTLVLTGSDDLSPEKIRELSWRLEPGRQHLIVAPALTDVGGPRIHTRPVAGLPLIHVETPRFEGSERFIKRMFDILASLALILVLAVPLLVIALAVKLDSPGPVLFRQERIGFRGRSFRMLKFRSMRVDAEQVLATLLDERDDGHDAGNAVLFKMKHDPRITRVGRFTRRFSLDELPQLFNVVAGDMSLVGPRPPLQREVDLYEQHVHRKFLVKPGITGLWQVSGRSNLSWEESVRLDLYYVENWSLIADLQILWRTAKAVVARDGAY